MSENRATMLWRREGAVFTDNRYSRGHRWFFDEGVEVPASSSPHIVRLPWSVPAAVDPEEAFVAALASCHLLTFLSIAARQGFVVDEYRDEAVGILAKNEAGRMVMTVVTLRPVVTFGGARLPTPGESDAMHHQAHEECFIAGSVLTDVRVEPVALPAATSVAGTASAP